MNFHNYYTSLRFDILWNTLHYLHFCLFEQSGVVTKVTKKFLPNWPRRWNRDTFWIDFLPLNRDEDECRRSDPRQSGLAIHNRQRPR
jgi:hypothetical protein